VVEEGVPQSITDFRRITDRNLSFAILIDTSISQEATLGGQQLAQRFSNFGCKAGRDQAAVATFTNTLAVEQGLPMIWTAKAAINRQKRAPLVTFAEALPSVRYHQALAIWSAQQRSGML